MTPLANLTPLTEVLPPTGTGKARSLLWYRGLKAHGYAVDFVAVVRQKGKAEDAYAVEEFAAARGRAFHVRKPLAASGYEVFCADAPTGYLTDSCSCAAGSYGKVARCRHLEVIHAVLDNGWLANPEERPEEWSAPYSDAELETLAAEYEFERRVGRGETVRVA